MKNAIILHGKPGQQEYYDPVAPSPSNAHWLPWLQKQLQIRGFAAHTPEVPESWNPQYDLWRTEFERYDITPETLLVGHSCGGGFLVRWLSEHPDVHADKTVLVAPSLGLDWEGSDFFEFSIDPKIAERTAGLVIFGSDTDRPAIKEAITTFRNTINGAQYREFPGYRHFCLNDLGTAEFPELRDELLK